MKRFVCTVALSVLATAAVAQSNDIQVTVSKGEAAQWSVVPLVYDQCVSGMVLRNDPSACRNLYPFLLEFAERVKKAMPPESPPASPAK